MNNYTCRLEDGFEVSTDIMPHGSSDIFRVGTITRWWIHQTDNELIAYFSSLEYFY